jgi:hypothetical protein
VLLAKEVARQGIVASVGNEGVRRLLKSHELKPWRGKMWCVPELNRESVERMEDALNLMEKPATEGARGGPARGRQRVGRWTAPSSRARGDGVPAGAAAASLPVPVVSGPDEITNDEDCPFVISFEVAGKHHRHPARDLVVKEKTWKEK